MIRAGLRTWLLTLPEVNALPGNKKVHVTQIPEGSSLPAVLLRFFDTDFNNTLDGSQEGDLVFSDVDIDCKSDTPTQAGALAGAIRKAIRNYEGLMGSSVLCEAVILDDESDSYEEKTKRYVSTLSLQLQWSVP